MINVKLCILIADIPVRTHKKIHICFAFADILTIEKSCGNFISFKGNRLYIVYAKNEKRRMRNFLTSIN